MVLHARTAIYRYAFFALFGRCRFCFCFCSCFVVIRSVTNFYSVLVQYDGSLVWLFGFGNYLSLLFCDDGMPYLKTFQLHIIGNTVLISATDERNHYRNFHCTGTCSDHEVRKAKALGCQRQSLKSPNLPDCMNYFRRLQEYEPRGTSSNMQHAKNSIQKGPQLY